MSDPSPEFSRPVVAATVESDGIDMKIKAEQGELTKLAERFGILGIERLEARIRLYPKGDLIFLEGHLTADVTQACVVSLEPVPQHIDADFTRSYGEEGAIAKALADLEDGIDLDAPDDDEPDAIENGMIDVGEAAAEELALQLDPFPRKPGASLENSPFLDGPGDEEGKPHPFAGLAKLRDKLDKKV